MKPINPPARAALVALLAVSLPLAAAAMRSVVQIKANPSELVAGKSTPVRLAVNPNRLLPKPRSEILYAWWCWDIDPRPRECEMHYCNSPVPDDPICAVPKTGSTGELIFEFADQGRLVDKARGACGSTDFVLMARSRDGSVSKVDGTVRIDCER